MNLNQKQKRQLRQLAHPLKPVVIVGNAGLSDSVVVEIDSSLEHHELMKVKLNAEDRAHRTAMAQVICQRTNAGLVQLIGQIAVFYRPARNPRLTLS